MIPRFSQKPVRAAAAMALTFTALSALPIDSTMTPARATDAKTPAPQTATVQGGARFLAIGVGKSLVIDLPRDVKDVLVADPTIANAVVRSAQRAYIIGVKQGQTNIVFFDASGNQIAGYDIVVTRDLNGIRAALKRVLPAARAFVDAQPSTIRIGVVSFGDGAAILQRPTDIKADALAAVDRKMNGLEFLKELRADQSLHNISVFVMTTSNDDKDRIEAYNYNVAGYIIKPISFENFVAAVSILNNFWQLCEQP